MKTLFDTETTPIIRDSYVFYRSFFDAIKKLSTKERLAAYETLMYYALDGVLPEKLSDKVSIIFLMAKPQLDANTKKYIGGLKGREHGIKGIDFGKLGGRPSKSAKELKGPENEQIVDLIDVDDNEFTD